MLLPRRPTLLSLLSILLSSTHTTPVHANPYPRDGDDALDIFRNPLHFLQARQCGNPCGYYNQVCCGSDEVCYTSAGLALCSTGTTAGATAAGGSWQVFTTTFTDVTVITSTYSAYVTAPAQQTFAQTTAPPAPVQTLVCDTSGDQTPCGSICCAAGQFCEYLGQCAAYGGTNSGGVASTNFLSSGTASVFIRPTSNTVATIVSTGTFTTTIPFETAVGTGGAALTGTSSVSVNNGLGGGAIAGIVIGVLAGFILLLLILACCCIRSAFDSLLELLGLRNRKRRVTETTITEERRRRTSGSAGAAPLPRRWYGNVFGGGQTTRVDTVTSRPPPVRKDSGGLGGLGAVAAGLAALAVVLGLRRRSAKKEEKSQYGSESSYTYDSRDYTGTSPSSLSTRSRDDRDRRSRR